MSFGATGYSVINNQTEITAGTLTLFNGAATVATFNLTLPSGQYFSGTFTEASNGSSTTIAVVPGGDAPPTIMLTTPTITSGTRITVPVPGVEVGDATVVPTMTVTVADTSGVLLANTSASGAAAPWRAPAAMP